MVIFYIAMLFAVLKENTGDLSWHNQCIVLWSMLLKSLCILIYPYTRNTVTIKQIIEIGAMYQTVFAIVVLDIEIGLFITYICICHTFSVSDYFHILKQWCRELYPV